jgi:alpha-glucoside transport system permease protein
VLTDRVRYETIAKAIFFMPMAISLCMPSIIWRFVYNPDANVGLLNAVLGIFGQNRAWLRRAALQYPSTDGDRHLDMDGFTMTLLSAALKASPPSFGSSAR